MQYSIHFCTINTGALGNYLHRQFIFVIAGYWISIVQSIEKGHIISYLFGKGAQYDRKRILFCNNKAGYAIIEAKII
jgi:hypothetical protein